MTTAQDALPSAKDAEQYVVGAICLDPSCIATVERKLSARDFTDPAHREALRTIAKLHRDGQELHITAIKHALEGNVGFAKLVGSVAAYLAEVGQAAATSAHLDYHVGLIIEASRKRRIYCALSTGAEHALNGHTATEIIGDVWSDLSDLRREIDRTADDKAAMFARWAESIVNRTAVTRYTCAPAWSDLAKFPVVAGRVALIGAPPGSGKTALLNQLLFDAVMDEGQQDLRVLILSVEVPPPDLLTRQLARLSGVGVKHLSEGTYDPDALPRIKAGMAELQAVLPRVDFVAPPFTLERLQERCEACDPEILLIDYIQQVDHDEPSRDARSQSTKAMKVLRQIASDDRAVLVVSAVNRAAYGGDAGMASFRESSELEYGCDSGWLLLIDEEDTTRIELKCVKHRQGSLESIKLQFNGSQMKFEDDRQAYQWNPADD